VLGTIQQNEELLEVCTVSNLVYRNKHNNVLKIYIYIYIYMCVCVCVCVYVCMERNLLARNTDIVVQDNRNKTRSSPQETERPILGI